MSEPTFHDVIIKDFSDIPNAVDEPIWMALTWMDGITFQHVLMGVVALFLLIFLLRHKRIMAEVRGSLLTIAGIISGLIHAVIAIGAYRLLW